MSEQQNHRYAEPKIVDSDTMSIIYLIAGLFVFGAVVLFEYAMADKTSSNVRLFGARCDTPGEVRMVTDHWRHAYTLVCHKNSSGGTRHVWGPRIPDGPSP